MLDRLLGLGGVAVVLGAAAWAVGGGPAAPVVTLVAIGLVLAAADALVWASSGTGEPDLTVPEGSRSGLPRWGLLVALGAALGLVATAWVGSAVGAVGAGVVLGAAVLAMLRPRSDLPPRVASTARRLRSFARAHGVSSGEAVDGYVTHVGESGGRLVVVAPDGTWADVMVAGDDVAAIAGLARIELREPHDPVAAQHMRTGRDEWARMARSW